MRFKQHWDHEKAHIFTKTTGHHHDHLDKMLGMAFEDLEHLSVRHQRIEFKKRASEIQKYQSQKYRNHKRGKGALI